MKNKDTELLHAYHNGMLDEWGQNYTKMETEALKRAYDLGRSHANIPENVLADLREEELLILLRDV